MNTIRTIGQRSRDSIVADWREMGWWRFLLGTLFSLYLALMVEGFLAVLWIGPLFLSLWTSITLTQNAPPSVSTSFVATLLGLWAIGWVFFPPILYVIVATQKPAFLRWTIKPFIMKVTTRREKVEA